MSTLIIHFHLFLCLNSNSTEFLISNYSRFSSLHMSTSKFSSNAFRVKSDNVDYTDDVITSRYQYHVTKVEGSDVIPVTENLTLRTLRKVPKTGLMIVGLGGNNGTTVVAGVLANKLGITWETKEGSVKPNFYGSITQASTIRLGTDNNGDGVYIPFNKLLPMLDPTDLVIGGWDISSLDMALAMKRAEVLHVNLQDQLVPHMSCLKPLPSIYYPDFIAANQVDRADNVINGTKQEQLDHIRQDICNFKTSNELDKVIVLWSANTERFAEVEAGVNDTADNIIKSISNGEDEIAPSTIFAVASILEGCSYINGSPQNTFVPGVMQLAEQKEVFIGGDDFKSGQTKVKSVLVDFLVSAGIKPVSIMSYNHLGNNDGKNLSAPRQFRSKEISKSNVVDDMVASNHLLYDVDESPDHCVVIKYAPHVGDSKRALDEYTSKIFLNGTNTICMHNTCEDSLLAAPLIIDLTLICELVERITIQREGEGPEKMHSALAILSYLLKAPLVPPGTPVINALFAQRECLVNIMRACVALPPENYMLLENKLTSVINARNNNVKQDTNTAVGGCIQS